MKAEYNNEGQCPLCGSNEIEYGTAEITCDDILEIETKCYNCGTQWHENRTFTDTGFYSTDCIVDKDGNEYTPEWDNKEE